MSSLTYHPQVVLILEKHPTILAVVLVVSMVVHVPIRCLLRGELQGTRFAGYLRRPVSNSCHVLGRRSVRAKLPRANLAFEASRCPVACAVHVLIASTLALKGTSAGLTFGLVVIVLHVLVTIILVIEGVMQVSHSYILGRC
jgi:hypothetical protein